MIQAALIFLLYTAPAVVAQFPTEDQFKSDALEDAAAYFGDSVAMEKNSNTYIVYKGFTADLNGDGDIEWIVSRSLNQEIHSVIVYYRRNDAWNHKVVNRCLGGSIVDIRIVDVDNDGRPEVYSILQDSNLRRYCRILSMTGLDFREIFTLDTPGGLYWSSNISLTRASTSEYYKVRVDEIQYPTSDDGDVRQKIYFYKMIDHMYVLDHMIGGRQ